MLSFNFTDGAVYIAQGERRGAGAVISAYGAAALPYGAVADGVIADAASVAEAIEVALAGAGMGKRQAAVVTAQSSLISSSEQVFPYSPKEKQMETMVAARLSATLSGGEYIFDYQPGERFTEEGAEKCRVDIYTAPRALIQGYDDLMERLGIKKRAFDVAKTLSRYLREADPVKYRDGVIAYLDDTHIELMLLCERDIMLRKAPVTREMGAAARSAELSSQLQKIVQYKQITYPGSAVGEVYLAGAQADSELCSELSEGTGLPVSPFAFPPSFSIPSGLAQAAYAFAGTALMRGR